ncbi:MAG: GerMN domain-containing protein [Synergistales bacterium]|nr:GerMN domain-containing protein [Synergistales bacterium]
MKKKQDTYVDRQEEARHSPPRRRSSTGGKQREEGGPARKAPLPFRLLAWASILIVFFGVGYVVAGFVMGWLDSGSKDLGGTVESRQEAAAMLEGDGQGTDRKRKKAYRIFPLGDSGLSPREVSVVPGIYENDLRHVLNELFEQLRVQSESLDPVRILHVFKTGDTLYIDLSSGFLSALSQLSRKRGQLFMTGLVRTVVDNFPPVRKVRILVNGKRVGDNAPLRLDVAWTLAPRS